MRENTRAIPRRKNLKEEAHQDGCFWLKLCEASCVVRAIYEVFDGLINDFIETDFYAKHMRGRSKKEKKRIEGGKEKKIEKKKE